MATRTLGTDMHARSPCVWVRFCNVIHAVSPRPLSSAALLVLLSGPRLCPCFPVCPVLVSFVPCFLAFCLCAASCLPSAVFPVSLSSPLACALLATFRVTLPACPAVVGLAMWSHLCRGLAGQKKEKEIHTCHARHSRWLEVASCTVGGCNV